MHKYFFREQYHRRKKFPALPLTQERLEQYPEESLNNRSLQETAPHLSKEVSSASTSTENKSNNVIKPSPELLQAPYQPFETIINQSNSRFLKRKNYKGQSIREAPKVKKVRSQLIDTRNIARREEPDKNVFTNAKKVDSGIKIKILPRSEETKRIVIKDSRYSVKNQSIFMLCSIRNIIKKRKIKIYIHFNFQRDTINSTH